MKVLQMVQLKKTDRTKVVNTYIEILPKYYHPYGALGVCGLYGTNGKTNVTNGSSGPNGLYRTSRQRAWAINWRSSYEQSKNRVRSVMQACLRERLWLYFYCATAPTVSESAKQRFARWRLCK